MRKKSAQPKVFTIPGNQSFLDSLVSGLRNTLDDAPDALSKATILLPTRRACRALRDTFLRHSEGKPILLPRLLPLGDLDQDEFSIGGSQIIDDSLGCDGALKLSVPPAIPNMRRLMVLTRLILAKPNGLETPDQAARLAKELARLLDQIHTEELNFDQIKNLAPENFSAHWQITLDFLTIISDSWPKILAADGLLDPTERRNRLLKALARFWTRTQPTETIIAAGSTGSIPATASLLSVISQLPNGAVILPGLDLDTDEFTWSQISPTHPQYGMAQLLSQMMVSRRNISIWSTDQTTSNKNRDFFVNVALAPAAASPTVIEKDQLVDALAEVTRLDCSGPSEEATAIALMMRETLETPNQTASLVTPDRNLARRVKAELKRWEIEVNDSAGTPLYQTPPGGFLCLIADVICEELAPVHLLALLKHPLTAMNYSPASLRHLSRKLEVTSLRGPRPNPGIEGLREVLLKSDPELQDLIDRLSDTLAPLLSLRVNEALNFSALIKTLIRCAEAVAFSDTLSGQERLWRGDAGEQAAIFISEILEWGNVIEVTLGRLPELLRVLMTDRVVRPQHNFHPRLSIWGPLEARLQTADLIILGGLNEGTWPPQASTNPWMSRSMMLEFGLPSPERRVGLSAHDFVQAMKAKSVALTRAERVDGTPTVPCRWLRRIDNLLARMGNPEGLASGKHWLDWVETIDQSSDTIDINPPTPKPPREVRPVKLSVTEVETLIRDPYAVYARHILQLNPIEPLDSDPGAAYRGLIIHAVLDEFINQYPRALPEDAEEVILEIGNRYFQTQVFRPGIRAFWWPRFQRIARWFVENERQRRKIGWEVIATEVIGERNFYHNKKTFTLTARADRIDQNADGKLSIIDYKTGQTPSDKQISAGLSPQLPLEAAIANANGFDGVLDKTVITLIYISLSGGRQPGEERALNLNIGQTTQNTVIGLQRLIQKYDDPNMPYLSQPRPMFENPFGEYNHLARLKEWKGRRHKQ